MDLTQEETLVEQAKSDMQAFGVLYDAYYGRVFSYALKRIADVHLAQDITSEVFFKALHGIRKFKWQNLRFSAWLYRIAGNSIADYYRDASQRKALGKELRYAGCVSNETTESEVVRLEAELREEAMLLRLQQILQTLPVLQQEVISLRFFEKKQLKEIAEILGKKEESVKTLLYRGVEKLRKEMIPDSSWEDDDG